MRYTERRREGPGEEVSREALGDDGFFERVGDLLDADELRSLDLTVPELVRERDRRLAVVDGAA